MSGIFFPVFVSVREDPQKGICLELFVLRRVRVIEGPLLQRYIFADESKKPAIREMKTGMYESFN